MTRGYERRAGACGAANPSVRCHPNYVQLSPLPARLRSRQHRPIAILAAPWPSGRIWPLLLQPLPLSFTVSCLLFHSVLRGNVQPRGTSRRCGPCSGSILTCSMRSSSFFWSSRNFWFRGRPPTSTPPPFPVDMKAFTTFSSASRQSLCSTTGIRRASRAAKVSARSSVLVPLRPSSASLISLASEARSSRSAWRTAA